jgi:hypothetical protein
MAADVQSHENPSEIQMKKIILPPKITKFKKQQKGVLTPIQ